MGKPKRERSLSDSEAQAVARNLRVSPRKLNLVAGLIRGKPVDAAIADLEQSVPTIPTVFAINPKEDVVNATYGSSQKVWQNKADFDSKVPPVSKAIADVKGKIKDVASLKVAYDSINNKCNECHETYRLKLK